MMVTIIIVAISLLHHKFCSLLPRSGSSSSDKVTVDAKPALSFKYSLDFPNLGHCIIINNKNFDRKTGNLLICGGI